jgi:hypothetical protein
MEQAELLRKIATTFDQLGIAYAVVGSIASTLYGEPRLTNDIDVVIDLRPEGAESFCRSFPAPDYYLSESAVRAAIAVGGQFNIIHPMSGLKIDCFVAGDEAFGKAELRRAVTIARENGRYQLRVAAPEDVILKKLEYFRLGESEKHVRDICGILMQTQNIDRAYIASWVEKHALGEVWNAVLGRLGGSGRQEKS